MVIPPDLEHAVEFEILHRMILETPGFEPNTELRLTARGLATLIARGVAAGLAKVQSAEASMTLRRAKPTERP